MVNSNLLKSKMVAAGYTQRTMAEAMKISKNTLNSKVNGKSCFDTDQVTLVCELLNITNPSEKCAIFLS
jgi:DNA-binding XRE family transcriptional regulator